MTDAFSHSDTDRQTADDVATLSRIAAKRGVTSEEACDLVAGLMMGPENLDMDAAFARLLGGGAS